MRSPLDQFGTEKSGSVAVMFCLALLPLFAAIGTAIDLTRAVEVRSAVQNALDATALNMAPNIGTVPNDNLQKKASEVFDNFFDGTGFTVKADKLQYGVKLTATGSSPTTIMKLLKIDKIDMKIAATAERPVKKIEVALVVDSSGSMAGDKMNQTKAAAKALVSILQGSEAASNTRMSIVPFDAQVNLGRTHSTSNWLDYTPLINFVKNKFNLTITKSEAQGYWPGCLTDRAVGYDTNDNAPGTTAAAGAYVPWICDSMEHKIKGNYQHALEDPPLASILPLTSTWSALNTKIDSLDPSNKSKTNLTIGIAWGLNTLTKDAPFAEADLQTDGVAKYMIVLTDGDNVKNARWSSHADDNGNNWYQGAYNSNASSNIDPLTTAACTAVKNKQITVYTVRVIAGNATLLSGCATNSTDYYKSITNASQLTEVFKGIGRNITALRLTH